VGQAVAVDEEVIMDGGW